MFYSNWTEKFSYQVVIDVALFQKRFNKQFTPDNAIASIVRETFAPYS